MAALDGVLPAPGAHLAGKRSPDAVAAVTRPVMAHPAFQRNDAAGQLLRRVSDIGFQTAHTGLYRPGSFRQEIEAEADAQTIWDAMRGELERQPDTLLDALGLMPKAPPQILNAEARPGRWKVGIYDSGAASGGRLRS